MSTTTTRSTTDEVTVTLSAGNESATTNLEGLRRARAGIKDFLPQNLSTPLTGKKTKTARVVGAPSDERFGEEQFIAAPELREVADMLRARHAMPTEITIECLWKRKGGKHQGKSVLAFCAKTSGLAKFFSQYDFVIWVAADTVRERGFGPDQIEALVYHELQHAGVDEESLEPIVIAHEFEGFHAELAVYGAWQADLERAANSFAQRKLF